MPIRTQAHQFTIQVDADAPAHADDHGLAVKGFKAPVEMLNEIPGNEGQTCFGAHHRFELRPSGFQPFLAGRLFALGGLLEVGVDVRPFPIVQAKLGEPALVVDRNRGLVLNCAPDVVDADVVAEHRSRIGVLALNRRAGKADEGGTRQRVPHVARVPVNEIVLAAVGFVGNDHDVAPVRQRGVAVALFFGQELLDGCEHHPARFHRKPGTQIRPAGRLDRRLAQQFPAAREGGEQLIVEIVAVGQDHHGRVFHRRLADDASGVERHRQAFAGPLRVPHHADAPVARVAARASARLVPPTLIVKALRKLRRA